MATTPQVGRHPDFVHLSNWPVAFSPSKHFSPIGTVTVDIPPELLHFDRSVSDLGGRILGRIDFLVLKLLLSLLIAGSISNVFGTTVMPSCGPNTLASYVANTADPNGCLIGILDYYDFSYHPVTNAPAASNIAVTPLASGFSFGPVTAAPNTTVQFEIDYDLIIDPIPIIGDSLHLDVSGDVSVTEYFCNDIDYDYSGSCAQSIAPQTLTITSTNGLPANGSIIFNPPANRSQQVGIVFTLIGGANGASFEGLDSTSILAATPEPASAPGLLLGLLTLAGGYKLRKQRHP